MANNFNFNKENINELFDNMPDAYFQTDAKGNIVFINSTLIKMFGYDKPSELIGHPSTSLYAQNNDREEIMQRLNETGSLRDISIKGIKKDGEKFWISLNANRIFDKNGNIAGKQGFVRDISARVKIEKQVIKAKEKVEESEEKFRNAFENSGIGMCLVGLDGSFLQVNKALCNILGYSKKELKNLTFQNITHEEDLEADLELLNKTLKGKIKNYQLKKRYFHKSGKIIYAILNVSLIRNENNKPLFFVSQIEDFTLLEKHINELKIAKEKAEESEKLKTAFLLNISHEIRTPMNGILGFISLLEDPYFDLDDKNEFLSLISKSGERLMNTINDIVEISKIEAGVMEIHNEIIDLNELMQYHYDFFHLQVQEKGLEFQISNNISTKFISDKHKLDGILTNLIKNAIKFTDQGKIEIGSYLKDNTICIFVSDTGNGIPKEKLKTIFDRFVQAELGLNKDYEGSGVGLSIIKSYVEALHGKIDVETKIGEGSKFSISIPYQETEANGN